jgi:hypothetical protein
MEASDFDQNVKLVTREHGFTGVHMIPYIGTYVSWVPWEWIEKNVPYPEPVDQKIRPGDEQRLKDWGTDTNDFARLKIASTVVNDDVPSDEEKKMIEKKKRKKKEKEKEKEERRKKIEEEQGAAKSEGPQTKREEFRDGKKRGG